MGYAVREAENRDVPALVELVFAYRKSQGADPADFRRENIEAAFRSALSEAGTTVLVCEKDGEAVGYIAYHLLSFPIIAGKELYVSDLLVSEKERDGGAGTLLLSEAEEYARKMGCVRMMLNNSKGAVSYARGFYVKRGFFERAGFANFIKRL